MLSSLGAQLHDPDRSILHRALRVAIVLPLLFAFGLLVLRDPQFALIAAFGSFAALGIADFIGPRRSRLIAHLVLGLVGAVLVIAGTALSNTLWPAVVAMLAVGVALQFAMALGGQFALGNNAAILAFVVAVMVPAGEDAVGSRVAGWITAMVCSALVATFLWPRHERRDLYQRVADACRSLAAVARALADGADPESPVAASREAIEQVRDAQRALEFRPLGPPGHQEALLGLIDALGEGWRFSRMMASSGTMNAADRCCRTSRRGRCGSATACAPDSRSRRRCWWRKPATSAMPSGWCSPRLPSCGRTSRLPARRSSAHWSAPSPASCSRPRREVAAHIRAGQRLVEAAFKALIGRADAAQVAAAHDAALAARHRADEAFAAYIGERGAKHVPLEVWGWLVRVPIVMRVAADAAIAMQRTGFHGVETGDAARLFNEAVTAVGAAYGELADRLEQAQRPPDPALPAAIADFDMIDGAGKQRAAILAATGAYAEAHRDDPATVARVMALTWGVGWLGYLAHIRRAGEPMLGELMSQADTPWWR